MVTLTKLFGLNSVIWFLYNSALGSLTVFFLYLYGRLLKFSFSISLFFSILVLLGLQSEVWARPMLPEAHGIFFLSASLMFLGLSSKVNATRTTNNFLFVILAILASLCKESIIIFIPTLIILKIWLYAEENKVSLSESTKENKVCLIILFFIFCLEILYIKFVLGTQATGYAGIDASSLEFSNILSTTKLFLERSHFEICITLALLLFSLDFFKVGKNNTLIQKTIPFILIFISSVIPQIYLYSKSGLTANYYVLPAIIGSSLLTAKLLYLLRDNSRFLAKLVISIIFIVLLWKEVPLVWSMYKQMATDAKEMNILFEKIELCTPYNEPILVVVNPRVRYEATLTLKRVLNFAFKRDRLLIATYGLEKANFFSTSLKEAEKVWAFLDPQAVVQIYNNNTILNASTQMKSQIKAIIIFDDLNNDFIRTSGNWFFDNNYNLTEFKVSFAPTILYCKK